VSAGRVNWAADRPGRAAADPQPGRVPGRGVGISGIATLRSGGADMTTDKNDLKDSDFAFPDERKEPLNDASHVRNAVARFNQVEGVSDAERDRAWKRITTAAKKFDVELSEKSWRELGS
jgi:hypothetical protein